MRINILFQSNHEKMIWQQMSHKLVEETIKNESFISDQSKDPDIEVKTIQIKKKRKQNKKKIIQKLVFQRAINADLITVQ